MFRCCSLETSHPRLLPQSPKVCSVHLCPFLGWIVRGWIFSSHLFTSVSFWAMDLVSLFTVTWISLIHPQAFSLWLWWSILVTSPPNPFYPWSLRFWNAAPPRPQPFLQSRGHAGHVSPVGAGQIPCCLPTWPPEGSCPCSAPNCPPCGR